MYRTILRYDTVHTIRTLYRTIHEHLWYADMIWNFFHMIWYVSRIVWYQQLWWGVLFQCGEVFFFLVDERGECFSDLGVFFFFVAGVFFLKRSSVSNVGRNLFMREFTILTHFDWFRLIKLEVFLTVKKKNFQILLIYTNIYIYIYLSILLFKGLLLFGSEFFFFFWVKISLFL